MDPHPSQSQATNNTHKNKAKNQPLLNGDVKQLGFQVLKHITQFTEHTAAKKTKKKKKNIKLSAVHSLALYVNNVSLFKQQGITKKGIYCQSQGAGEPLLKGTAQAALVVCVTKKLNHLLIRHQTNHLTSHVSRSPYKKKADMLF